MWKPGDLLIHRHNPELGGPMPPLDAVQ